MENSELINNAKMFGALGLKSFGIFVLEKIFPTRKLEDTG